MTTAPERLRCDFHLEKRRQHRCLSNVSKHQAIAVDRDELLLAQVAIDDSVGLDPLWRIRSRGGVVRRASQHEPQPDHRDRTAAAKQQHPLTLPRLGIEGADRVVGGIRRLAVLGSCGGAHAPAPSVCTT